MKKLLVIVLSVISLAGCTTEKDLAYLNNLPETGGEGYFTLDVPYYKIQPRDILYVSVKTQTPDGGLQDILAGAASANASYAVQTEASQYISGYSVDPKGKVNLPLLGMTPVNGKNIYEVRDIIQSRADSLFRHAYVEVRLLSFKFTVIGEVKLPGSYFNYNDQLTVLEAIGRAGGLTDVGSRRNILVVRPMDKKTMTYHINLQEKNLLESPAYFLTPNDVVIVQGSGKKIFNVNLPTYSFILTGLASSISTTLLLINYFGPSK